jgi:para-aminobenzoate synthetase component 1
MRELPWIEPIDAFLRFADDDFTTFFDGCGAAGPRARFSYLCVDPFKIMRDVSWQALQAEMARFPVPFPRAPLPFAGGAAGFAGYEAGTDRNMAARPPGDFAGVPDMQFGLFDIVFSWDHETRRSWLVSAFAETAPRARMALDRLRETPPPGARPRLSWRADVTREDHIARVQRTLAYIRAGDVYQANITASFTAARPAGLRAADIYLALRAGNDAPFSAFINTGQDCAVASVSPERFLRLTAEGSIEARPIKGTRPRGATAEADEAQAAALLASAKDRAENLMIVDLLRNDISRVALPGSVRVPSLHGLETFPHLHHLVSVVTGRLRPGCSAVDLLRAAFPGGSITGAPKIRAMQIIAELERAARGPYCGAAVWLGPDGAMDSSILIRTVTIATDRIVAQAGGGIVADSEPAEEWEELLVKIRPILRALDPGWA